MSCADDIILGINSGPASLALSNCALVPLDSALVGYEASLEVTPFGVPLSVGTVGTVSIVDQCSFQLNNVTLSGLNALNLKWYGAINSDFSQVGFPISNATVNGSVDPMAVFSFDQGSWSDISELRLCLETEVTVIPFAVLKIKADVMATAIESGPTETQIWQPVTMTQIDTTAYPAPTTAYPVQTESSISTRTSTPTYTPESSASKIAVGLLALVFIL
jgi:hypothetical protein